MAKRELSSTLRNLKFMQRIAKKEENPKVEEEVVAVPNGDFPAPSRIRKCVVIVEGDPHPETMRGRMSFQNFNPIIDKLNEEPSNSPPREPMDTNSGRDSETKPHRLSVTPQAGIENFRMKNSGNGSSGKRKSADGPKEALHPPHKLQKNNVNGNKAGPEKQELKREKLDWNVLRPSKHHNKRK